MSTLYQKRDTWYYQWYSESKKHQKSLKTKDRQVAKRLQKIYDGKMEQGKFGILSVSTKFEFAINQFLERKKPLIKESTHRKYRNAATFLLNFFDGIVYCKQLTPDMLSEYIADRMKKGKANKTIFEELVFLKAALKAICNTTEIEALLKNFPRIKISTAKPETIGNYTIEEIEKMKEYFKSGEFEAIFLFAIYTGCRLSEIENIRWEDVNLSGRLIRIENIKTKSNIENQFRTIAIHPELLKLLEQRKKSGLVFPELQQHFNEWHRKHMMRACKALNIQYRRFHGLRHTTATYLLASGVSLRDVMQLMGWTRLDTARRYIHLADNVAEKITNLPY